LAGSPKFPVESFTPLPADMFCAISIPQSPKSTQDRSVQFFLKYHQETINSAHYFRYYDYQKLHTFWLPAMADEYECLRHAMVAFSALIYSIKVTADARQLAFYYYSVALKELQSLLTTKIDCNLVVASALQLSSIDVHHFEIHSLKLAILWRNKKMFTALKRRYKYIVKVFRPSSPMFVGTRTITIRMVL
jgi:hypothetical protein